MANPPQQDWILGLDLGVNSVGWARLTPELGLLDAGARVFEAGNEGDIKKLPKENWKFWHWMPALRWTMFGQTY